MSLNALPSVLTSALLKKPVLITLGVVGALTIVGVTVSSHQDASQKTRYTVTRDVLEQSVFFSGSVVPQSRVTLAFERPGRVASLPYDVGDTVVARATVATLDADTAHATRAQQAALLESEQAALDELLSGTRQEEIAVSQAQVTQREVLVVESRESLTAAIINAFTVADTALERTADPLFDDPTSATPNIRYTTTQNAIELALENERLALEPVRREWRSDIATLEAWQARAAEQAYTRAAPPFVHRLLGATITATLVAETEPDITLLAQRARERTLRFAAFFENLNTYTGNLTLTSGLTQTQIDSFTASVATERAALQTALSTLVTKREGFVTAQSNLRVATEQLTLAQAPTRAEAIAAARARVRAQQSAVQSADVEIQKHILRAPQHGVVTQVHVEEGELVTTSTSAITLDASGSFEVDARVSELDVVLLEEGMHAEVTTDAYGPTRTFPGTLTRIDPAESVVNGVPGYGVVVTLTDDASILKAGMTANVTVSVVLANDVLIAPNGFIERTADGAFVYVVERNKVQRTRVTLGAQTVDGRVAILEGLVAGTTLVPYAEARDKR